MLYRRITSDGTDISWIRELETRISRLETPATGNVAIRGLFTATDPVTGVQTQFGTLPDGTGSGFKQFVYDITPPPVATAPVAKAEPGVFIISWDGLFVGGESAPSDFECCNIIGHKIVDGATVSSVPVGMTRRPLDITFVQTDVAAFNETWNFSLEAEDYNGNRAEWSARSNTVTMQPIAAEVDLTEIEADIQQAKDDAAAAQTAAANAQTDADAAEAAALAASNLAAGKNKVHYVTTSPGATGNNVGDMWVDIDDSYKLYTWSGSGWIKTQDSKEALDLAGTKIRSFVQGTAPTAISVGDIWMNTSNKNELYRWSGSSWVSYRDLSIADADAKAATAIANAATAQETADGKVITHFQTTAPTGKVAGDAGDLWFDTDDGNKMYRWTGSAWVVADDQRIAAAVTAASNAQTVADSKITTLYQPAQPSATGRTVGDLWVDTDDQNKLYRWNGTSWDSARDLSIAAASNAAATAQEAANSALSAAQAAQATADGAIRTFYQSAAPTGLNNTTNVGDLWFDTDDGQAYRWNGSAWVIIEDNSIAAALAAAQNAQTTADGKITSYYQPGQPAVGEVGDLWFDTDDKNRPYYCSSISPLTWTQVRDGAIADAQSTANTALTSANGKNVTYYQTAQPSGGTYILGDTWIDTDAGNKMYVYNGSAWVSAQDGAIGDALTLAASKGKVIVQSTAPDAADQLAQNLWIDTTNNANTPKRWNGSAWVVVTDKVATDAAAAVIVAQARADQAFNNAATAAEAAGNAQTTANGKNRVWYQDEPPAGTAHRQDDLWFDTNNDNKISRWNATSNLWVESLIGNNAILANLDAGKITVGFIAAAVLKAKSITVDKLVISSTDNLIVEADFTNSGSSWGPLTTTTKTINATAGRGGGPAFRVTATSILQTLNNLVNKVTVGTEDRFRGSFYVRSSVALAAGAVKLNLRCYTTATASTTITVASNPVLVANTYTLVEGISPVLPAGTIAIEFFLEVLNPTTATITDIDYVAMVRAADGRLVLDGAMDAKTITAPIIQSDNTPLDSTSSRGYKLTPQAFRAYNTLGQKTFEVLTSTGAVSITGTYSSGTTAEEGENGVMTGNVVRATMGIIQFQNYTNTPGIMFESHAASNATSTTPKGFMFYYWGGIQIRSTTPSNVWSANRNDSYVWVPQDGVQLASSNSGLSPIVDNVTTKSVFESRTKAGTASSPQNTTNMRIASYSSPSATVADTYASILGARNDGVTSTKGEVYVGNFVRDTVSGDGQTFHARAFSTWAWDGTMRHQVYQNVQMQAPHPIRSLLKFTGSTDSLPYSIHAWGETIQFSGGPNAPDGNNNSAYIGLGADGAFVYAPKRQHWLFATETGIGLAGSVQINGDGNIRHGRAEFTTTNFNISGGNTPWDPGPATADTNPTRTLNNDFCKPRGNGAIEFTRAGYYEISILVIPQVNAPGNGWLKLNHSALGLMGMDHFHDGLKHETYICIAPTYFQVGEYVHATIIANNSHTANTRWKVVRSILNF